MTAAPCPFCGAPPRDLVVLAVFDDRGSGVMVRCDFCSAQGPVARVNGGDRTTAVELWNDRSGKAAHVG